MLDELRDRMSSYISAHRVCLLSTSSTSGAWGMPVRLASDGLEMVCLLPSWSDALYHIEQDARVMAVILDTRPEALCWLQVRGLARLIEQTGWEASLSSQFSGPALDGRYRAVRITPVRLDFYDESLGWGVQETLDL